MNLLVNQLDLSRSKQEGFVTKGRIVSLINGFWMVDIGSKCLVRLEKWFVESYVPNPAIGKQVLVYISRYADANGQSKIDQSKVVYQFYLNKIKKAQATQEDIPAKIIRIKQGGLVAEIFPHLLNGQEKSFKAFLPGSRTSFVNPSSLLNTEVRVKIQSCNLKQNSLIVEFNADNKFANEALDLFKVGNYVEGKILRLGPYGAIVKVSKFNCYLSYRDLCFDPDKQPSTPLRVNQVIESLRILKKDEEKGKVFLSAQEYFDSLSNYINEGEEVVATIKNIKQNFYLLNIENKPFLKGFMFRKDQGWGHFSKLPFLKKGDSINCHIGSIENKYYVPLIGRRNSSKEWNLVKEDFEQNFSLGSLLRLSFEKNRMSDLNSEFLMAKLISLPGSKPKDLQNSNLSIPCIVVGHNLSEGLVEVLSKKDFYYNSILRFRRNNYLGNGRVWLIEGNLIYLKYFHKDTHVELRLVYLDSLGIEDSSFKVGDDISFSIKTFEKGRILIHQVKPI